MEPVEPSKMLQQLRDLEIFEEVPSNQFKTSQFKIPNTNYHLELAINSGMVRRLFWLKQIISPYIVEEQVSFEEVFENCSPEIKEKFIFHLDLFRNT